MKARERIADLWAHAPKPLGTPGFELLDISSLEWRSIGGAENDNWVVAPPGSKWHESGQIKIREGDVGNVMIFGQDVTASGDYIFWGNGNTIIFSDRLHVSLNCYIDGLETLTFIGKETKIIGASIFNQMKGTMVAIGERCLFSHAIVLRSYDDHSIIDLDTGNQVNLPENILISPYVWLCPEVHVLKGAKIGYGSIIGQRSLVTSPVGSCVLAAGVPAKVLRERVSWDPAKTPRPDLREMVLAGLGKYA